MNKILIAVLLFIGISCAPQRDNPLDPSNPNSNAVALPAPTNVNSTSNYGNVTLTWDSVSDAVEYKVYRDGEIITAVTTTKYEDNGLPIDKTYGYQIAAVHSSGLIGYKSVIANVTTSGGYDVEITKKEIYARQVIVNQNCEQFKIRVYLKNTGSYQLYSVRAYVTCSSGYISNIKYASYSYIYYGDIAVGDERSAGGGYYDVEFCVSLDTPSNTKITFDVAVSDLCSHTWDRAFSYTFQ